mmetsp:Transcript_36811/g.60936  ORF Transcript_36811/g.60936 Transcript_36811/m.60936 type:complete len:857 (-) Transcript_36811:264-2834(-)|eukprot:CAMPEP_0119336952 /NCGR_PEP_ID=MMETSP1333-20130426/92946_1 /TAXON_ID=418940 /ORGANISM="Scyphosphaera apsteinii, Strain RCC1455" /LENGTH=856 /DNA_ID=CAMNT_0007347889 /DNA_START=39 /DNA_END=2609 /DNA_ORIENTATION=-
MSSSLTQEVQHERGCSCAFVGSGGALSDFKRLVLLHREGTDKFLQSNSDLAASMLPALARVRSLVDVATSSTAQSAERAVAFYKVYSDYTKLIEMYLRDEKGWQSESFKAKNPGNRRAAFAFAGLTELMGRERAFICGILSLPEDAIKYLPTRAFADFVMCMTQQRHAMSSVRASAPPQLLALLTSGFKLQPKLHELHETLLQSFDVLALKREGLTIRLWWQLITCQINRMFALQTLYEKELCAFEMHDEPHTYTAVLPSVLERAEYLSPMRPRVEESSNFDEWSILPNSRSPLLHAVLLGADKSASPWSSEHSSPPSPLTSPRRSFGSKTVLTTAAQTNFTVGTAAGHRSIARPCASRDKVEKIPASVVKQALLLVADDNEFFEKLLARCAELMDGAAGVTPPDLDDAADNVRSCTVRSGRPFPSTEQNSQQSEKINHDEGSRGKMGEQSEKINHVKQIEQKTEVSAESPAEIPLVEPGDVRLRVPLFRDKFEEERAPLNANMISLDELALVRRIGKGGFSTTYAAHWKSGSNQHASPLLSSPCEANVAVKVASDVGDSLFQWKREVSALTRLYHPNIVRYFGFVEQPPTYCLVLELCHGGDLFERLKEPTPAGFVLHIATGIAAAMTYLHENNIIHRDIKSTNVLLDEDGMPKLTDFGVAVDLPDRTATSKTGVLTAETGTYRWMAPEVMRHEPYSASADIYSAGMVLYELVCHHVPFVGVESLQVAAFVALQDKRPPLPQGLPRILSVLLVRMWSKNRARRPRSSELYNELNKISQILTAEQHLWLDAANGNGVVSSSTSGIGLASPLPDLQPFNLDRTRGVGGAARVCLQNMLIRCTHVSANGTSDKDGESN